MELRESLKKRRSFYEINKDSLISDEKIAELVEYAVKYTPSAFNSQSQNTVLLFGASHEKLWDITMDRLKKIVPVDNFSSTESKINSFRAGHGTVLYFDNGAITKSLQENYPLYKDNFPIWAEQSNGMLQITIWNMLVAEGLGANLQHYNPLIDEDVKSAFDIPKEWRLIAQMPFGNITAQPPEKEFADLPSRIRILK